ncbi:histidine phosphatase family protein [Pseudonocardia endophytica]|uniref:Putative phosphoglycerate mutase n=1 Tax=Pseudonocardia endophytica TaxID=401976 RepID=A0A4V2PHM4_PSEEN|nr:histidine phosphatase family protein [Pseudonocardia endophytica]TCK21296.1 putative phosphoglycerate mutase [Pseudonocardia endophytica]
MNARWAGRRAGARLHLVRHGQSTWNAEGLLQGQTLHVPLSPDGVKQALTVAEALEREPVGEVWTSDQLRCVQTAELVAARHHLRVRRSVLLREQCHGIWEGTPVAGRAAVLAAADPDWAPAGGETPRELLGRAGRFLGALNAGAPHRVAATGPDVVVVSHGETIRALFAAALGLGVERMPTHIPVNGTVHTISPGPVPAEPAPLDHRTASRPEAERIT